MVRSTRHGLPTATTLAGMSFVTTLPAPITVFSPMVTPGTTITPAPSQQLRPMRMGRLYWYALMLLGLLFLAKHHKRSGFPDVPSIRPDTFCCSGRSGVSVLPARFSACSPNPGLPEAGGSTKSGAFQPPTPQMVRSVY